MRSMLGMPSMTILTTRPRSKRNMQVTSAISATCEIRPERSKNPKYNHAQGKPHDGAKDVSEVCALISDVKRYRKDHCRGNAVAQSDREQTRCREE